jgi:hypothetical protein
MVTACTQAGQGPAARIKPGPLQTTQRPSKGRSLQPRGLQRIHHGRPPAARAPAGSVARLTVTGGGGPGTGAAAAAAPLLLVSWSHHDDRHRDNDSKTFVTSSPTACTQAGQWSTSDAAAVTIRRAAEP